MKKLLIPIFISTLFTGCASITGTTGQSVSVQTKKGDEQVSGANCELANSKGKWFVTTPGSVPIGRSNDDLQVTCKKDGMDQGVVNVVPDTKGSMFGNILFGGGIGAIIDHNTGAAYEYPTLITVLMGEISTVKTEKVAYDAGSVKSASKVSNPSVNQAEK